MEKYMGWKNVRKHWWCKDQVSDHCRCLQAGEEVERSGLWRTGGNLCFVGKGNNWSAPPSLAMLLEEAGVMFRL